MSGPRTAGASGPAVATASELYAEALALETEAAERYAELADQMETHNNREVAGLFRKLADIEGRHAAALRARAGVSLASGTGGSRLLAERPETAPLGEAHYLMTPAHALQLALASEERAEAFFRGLARDGADPEIRGLAAAFADEEREHIELLRAWLAKYPMPQSGWADDPDPPVLSE